MKSTILNFLTAAVVIGAIVAPFFFKKEPTPPSPPSPLDYTTPSVIGECAPGKPPCTLRIPPLGKSFPIGLAVGYRAKFTGKNFRQFCFYTNNKTLEAPCPDGPIVLLYLVDTSGVGNDVLYEQVPM